MIGDFNLRKNKMKVLSLDDSFVIVVSIDNNYNKEKNNDHLRDYLTITYTIWIRQLILMVLWKFQFLIL